MDEAAVMRAAQRLAKARCSRGLVEPLPADCRPASVAEALTIQERLHTLLAEQAPGPRVGYKIGCTSKTMQNYLGVDHPCSGGLFEGSLRTSPAEVSLSDYRRLGIELEIAVRLGRDLPRRDAPYSTADAAAAVAACFGSIELVDDRYSDWPTMGTPSLVADDFFSAGCIVGAAAEKMALDNLDQERCELFTDDFSTAIGYGRDILEHPLEALRWLANNAPFAEGLHAGQVITLGSVVRTQWLERPCRIEARYASLGGVGLTVTA